MVSAARERGEEAIVVTFWPHPRTVLQQDARDLRLLSTQEEKKELLHEAGIDRVEVLPFTRSFASLKAADYLTLLRDRFHASLIVMGYDNRIGSDNLTASEICAPQAVASRPLPECVVLRMTQWAPPGEPGDIACPPYNPPRGISALTGQAEGGHVPADHTSPAPVSSTQIRKALEEGKIDEANGMLGYRYGLYGVVVAGNRMGRTIGFPTANMQLYEPLKLVPANGAYVVEVEVLGKKFTGMCNIGLRPTVDGKARTIETHILDFDEDIYGLPMGIRFVRRLRDERKFPSLDALREQLEIDKSSIK